MNPMDMNYSPMRVYNSNVIANIDQARREYCLCSYMRHLPSKSSSLLLLCGLALPVRVSIEAHTLQIPGFKNRRILV